MENSADKIQNKGNRGGYSKLKQLELMRKIQTQSRLEYILQTSARRPGRCCRRRRASRRPGWWPPPAGPAPPPAAAQRGHCVLLALALALGLGLALAVGGVQHIMRSGVSEALPGGRGGAAGGVRLLRPGGCALRVCSTAPWSPGLGQQAQRAGPRCCSSRRRLQSCISLLPSRRSCWLHVAPVPPARRCEGPPAAAQPERRAWAQAHIVGWPPSGCGEYISTQRLGR